MACGSVAVSTATVTQVTMESDTLKGMLAALTGSKPDQVETYHYDQGQIVRLHNGKRRELRATYDQAAVETTIDGTYARVTITQRVETAETTLTLYVDAGDQAASNRVKAALQQQFDKLVIQGQQASILKRLSQLGKLSSVQQKDGGVTARIVVEI